MDKQGLLGKKGLPDGSLPFCEACNMCKPVRQPHPSLEKAHKAKEGNERVHTDVCGPLSVGALGGGERYFVTFLDEHTHHLTVYLVKHKSQVIDCLTKYAALANLHFGRQLKTIRCDNGGEYTSKEVKQLTESWGTVMEYTTPYTPQANGMAERMNRTLLAKVRCTLHQGNLPNYLWGEVLLGMVHVVNVSTTGALVSGRTPYEEWHGRKPNLVGLHVVGCDAYAISPNHTRSKLDPVAEKLTLVACRRHGYRLWNKSKRKLILASDVSFSESGMLLGDEDENKAPDDGDADTEYAPLTLQGQHQGQQQGPAQQVQGLAEETNAENKQDLDGAPEQEDHSVRVEAGQAAAVNPEQDARPTARTWDDEVEGASMDGSMGPFDAEDEPNPVPNEERGRRDVDVHAWDPLLFATMASAVKPKTTGAPATYKEASSGGNQPEWRDAMNEEMLAMGENEVFDLVDLPASKRAISSKWTYALKTNELGEVVRFKARLVAKGFMQEEGVDYEETFAPVANFTTIRVVLALAAARDWDVQQMDVTTAFLYGELAEEVYMSQPEGYVVVGSEGKVWKLKRGLYGLKQACRGWNERLDRVLQGHGYEKSERDHCLYTKTEGEASMYIVVYVDDLMLVSGSKDMMAAAKAMMTSEFKMKDMGAIRLCLGLVITRDRPNRKLWINQEAFMGGVISMTNQDDCTLRSTPMEAGLRLSKDTPGDEPIGPNVPFRKAIGKLAYAAQRTRPDIANAVGVISSFQANPRTSHWHAVQRVVQYLKGTPALGLLYEGGDSDGNLKLTGWADADYANGEDRKSITGYLFRLGGATVSWRSRKQVSTSSSTVEAEYMAATAAVKEAMWLRGLLMELGTPQIDPTDIMEDNQGCIAVSNNPCHTSRVKHIDIQYHFTREKVRRGLVELIYTPTVDQTADVLTKPLPKSSFIVHRVAMGLVAPPAPT